jgi:transglutaminase-like putative cysteine protease
MRIRAGYDIAYDLPRPTPMVLLLNVRPERRPDVETYDTIYTEPNLAVHAYVDAFGNRCSRIMAPAGRVRLYADFVVRDSGQPDPIVPFAGQTPVEHLPDDVLIFLLASRYCETDMLMDLAWSLFGNTPPGWKRVQTIVDYVHQRIKFGYEHARPTRTAGEGHAEQVGVCRDYAHLAVALCRCMNIPARYCTGFLGDIGVPYSPAPMDFSAWFEVYLGGAWRTFDARHNKPRIGRICMAVGRDAADTAITTTFGPNVLSRFEVITEEVA